MHISFRHSRRVNLRESAPPRGFTLLELLIVCLLVAVTCVSSVFSIIALRDGIHVRSATREVESIFASARETALSQSAYATVVIIKDPPSLNLVIDEGKAEEGSAPPVQTSTLLKELYGVSITSNRSAITYGPNGITAGVANFTITISKGASSDTITMSRLGRIRHSSS